MLTEKEFDVLTSLEASKRPLSQRALATGAKISLGMTNKIVSTLTERGLIADGTITEAGLAALEPYRVKRAVFLAAGFGSRLVPITLNTPKPLVRVKGKRIIDSLLDAIVSVGTRSLPLISKRVKNREYATINATARASPIYSPTRPTFFLTAEPSVASFITRNGTPFRSASSRTRFTSPPDTEKKTSLPSVFGRKTRTRSRDRRSRKNAAFDFAAKKNLPIEPLDRGDFPHDIGFVLGQFVDLKIFAPNGQNPPAEPKRDLVGSHFYEPLVSLDKHGAKVDP